MIRAQRNRERSYMRLLDDFESSQPKVNESPKRISGSSLKRLRSQIN